MTGTLVAFDQNPEAYIARSCSNTLVRKVALQPEK
jgi:hypothetical protein